VRGASEALRVGSYRALVVESTLLAFERAAAAETVVVAVNLDADPAAVALPRGGSFECLESGEHVTVEPDAPLRVPGYGARIVRRL